MEMPRTDSTQAMQTLIGAYADDDVSEEEENNDVHNISGSEDEAIHVATATQSVLKEQKSNSENGTPPVKKSRLEQRKATRLVSYGADDLEDDDKDVEDEEEFGIDQMERAAEQEEIISHVDTTGSISVGGNKIHDKDVQLPPEPSGKCSNKLQEKITKFYDRMLREGLDLNDAIQKRKDFRNPSIYEKLITFCGINEKGTNYPLELYNPTIFGPESLYDELAKAQKSEMDRRERERKDRTKIEFVVGTKKSNAADGASAESRRKSKWDAQPQQLSQTGINPAAIATTSVTGTKGTVIPAIGALKKSK